MANVRRWFVGWHVNFIQKSKEILEQIKQELEGESIVASLRFDKLEWMGIARLGEL